MAAIHPRISKGTCWSPKNNSRCGAGDRFLSPALRPWKGRPQKAVACPTEQQSRNQTCGARSLARHAGSPAGGTADMAGLATCSTASKSSREEKVLRCCSTLLSHVPLSMRGCIERWSRRSVPSREVQRFPAALDDLLQVFTEVFVQGHRRSEGLGQCDTFRQQPARPRCGLDYD